MPFLCRAVQTTTRSRPSCHRNLRPDLKSLGRILNKIGALFGVVHIEQFPRKRVEHQGGFPEELQFGRIVDERVLLRSRMSRL